jgi:hypothetical protein
VERSRARRWSARRPLRRPDLGRDEVQLVARPLHAEAREGARRQARDTYFEPPPTNYKVTWMARNEDFFALRWGVPDFIREHIALNGGVVRRRLLRRLRDLHPGARLLHRDRRSRSTGRWAFERQWLFYKLWGRLLYDPDTPDAVFQAEFNRRYGPQAAPLLAGLRPRLRHAAAARVALRLALGLHALQRGVPRAAGRPHEDVHLGRPIDQPADDGSRLRLRADYVAAGGAGASFGPAGSPRRC